MSESNFEKALLYHQQGQFKHAITFYQEAVKLNPEYDKAYLYLSQALIASNQIQEAIDTLKIALNHCTRHLLILNNLGNLHQILQQPTRALRYFKDAIDYHPEQPLIVPHYQIQSSRHRRNVDFH